MANYIVTDHIIGPDDLATVAAAAETYLETLDSTTQAVIDISYVRQGSLVSCVILHNDTS